VPTRRHAGSRNERTTRERRLHELIRAEQSQAFDGGDEILKNLSRDPSIRMNEQGRAILRWLHSQRQQIRRDWSQLANRVPDHCKCLVADLACSIAESWLELAMELRRQGTFRP
jgi:hypothetical protein